MIQKHSDFNMFLLKKVYQWNNQNKKKNFRKVFCRAKLLCTAYCTI